jgi:hypothetical protein
LLEIAVDKIMLQVFQALQRHKLQFSAGHRWLLFNADRLICAPS